MFFVSSNWLPNNHLPSFLFDFFRLQSLFLLAIVKMSDNRDSYHELNPFSESSLCHRYYCYGGGATVMYVILFSWWRMDDTICVWDDTIWVWEPCSLYQVDRSWSASSCTDSQCPSSSCVRVSTEWVSYRQFVVSIVYSSSNNHNVISVYTPWQQSLGSLSLGWYDGYLRSTVREELDNSSKSNFLWFPWVAVLFYHWDRVAYVSSVSHRSCVSDVGTMNTVAFSPERDARFGATCHPAGYVCCVWCWAVGGSSGCLYAHEARVLRRFVF